MAVCGKKISGLFCVRLRALGRQFIFAALVLTVCFLGGDAVSCCHKQKDTPRPTHLRCLCIIITMGRSGKSGDSINKKSPAAAAGRTDARQHYGYRRVEVPLAVRRSARNKKENDSGPPTTTRLVPFEALNAVFDDDGLPRKDKKNYFADLIKQN